MQFSELERGSPPVVGLNNATLRANFICRANLTFTSAVHEPQLNEQLATVADSLPKIVNGADPDVVEAQVAAEIENSVHAIKPLSASTSSSTCFSCGGRHLRANSKFRTCFLL